MSQYKSRNFLLINAEMPGWPMFPGPSGISCIKIRYKEALLYIKAPGCLHTHRYSLDTCLEYCPIKSDSCSSPSMDRL